MNISLKLDKFSIAYNEISELKCLKLQMKPDKTSKMEGRNFCHKAVFRSRMLQISRRVSHSEFERMSNSISKRG